MSPFSVFLGVFRCATAKHRSRVDGRRALVESVDGRRSTHSPGGGDDVALDVRILFLVLR